MAIIFEMWTSVRVTPAIRTLLEQHGDEHETGSEARAALERGTVPYGLLKRIQGRHPFSMTRLLLGSHLVFPKRESAPEKPSMLLQLLRQRGTARQYRAATRDVFPSPLADANFDRAAVLWLLNGLASVVAVGGLLFWLAKFTNASFEIRLLVGIIGGTALGMVELFLVIIWSFRQDTAHRKDE